MSGEAMPEIVDNACAEDALCDLAAGISGETYADTSAEVAGEAVCGTTAGSVASTSDAEGAAAEETPVDWREELAAKMQEYRTRRKPRAPKYPSLQLPFEVHFEKPAASSEPIAWSSLALEPPPMQPLDFDEPLFDGPKLDGPQLVSVAAATEPVRDVEVAPPFSNVIEFPRYGEMVLGDELAEPLIEQPRILEAPEVAPAAPALGGILLEAPEDPNAGIVKEAPLQPASIGRRLAAVVLDMVVVALAAALFGWTFSKVAHEIPPRPQLLVSGAVALAALWLGYQYLLLAWSGTTFGLSACGLELACIDGSVPKRRQRRLRLLASCLSAASVMLGYAWVLLDENRLCWHDRITRTYLRVRAR